MDDNEVIISAIMAHDKLLSSTVHPWFQFPEYKQND